MMRPRLDMSEISGKPTFTALQLCKVLSLSAFRASIGVCYFRPLLPSTTRSQASTSVTVVQHTLHLLNSRARRQSHVSLVIEKEVTQRRSEAVCEDHAVQFR